MKTFILLSFSFLACSSPNLVYAQTNEAEIDIKNVDFPKVEGVSPNDVYGAVTYELASYKSADEYQGAIKRLLGVISDQQGKYLITLQLKSDKPDPIAIVPIAQAEIDEKKKFLFFTESYKYVAQRSWRGVLMDGPMVSQLGNNLKVTLVAYYSNASQVNFDTFVQLSALGNSSSLAFLTAAESAGSMEVWSQVSNLVRTITSSMKEIKVGSETSMSFINLIPTDPNEILIETKTPGGVGKLKLTVKFLTKPSLFSNYDLIARKYTPPVLADNFWRATLAKKPLQEVINTTDDPEIRKFYAELQSSDGYKGSDIGSKCQAMKDFFAKYFNSRDEYAIYWAFLKRSEGQLKKNANYKDCLNPDLRQALDDMGLKTAALLQ